MLPVKAFHKAGHFAFDLIQIISGKLPVLRLSCLEHFLQLSALVHTAYELPGADAFSLSGIIIDIAGVRAGGYGLLSQRNALIYAVHGKRSRSHFIGLYLLLCEIKENTNDDIDENYAENDNSQIDIQRLSVLSDFTILSGQSAILRTGQPAAWLPAVRCPEGARADGQASLSIYAGILRAYRAKN